ncbi:Protein-Glutamine Gamma-Glutamyltransferase 6 [Manis pentadactyla]|nr:Protein-Glutamine Gamma-Glutamyltransferase 6 [Manis pentadactyla]
MELSKPLAFKEQQLNRPQDWSNCNSREMGRTLLTHDLSSMWRAPSQNSLMGTKLCVVTLSPAHRRASPRRMATSLWCPGSP